MDQDSLLECFYPSSKEDLIVSYQDSAEISKINFPKDTSINFLETIELIPLEQKSQEKYLLTKERIRLSNEELIREFSIDKYPILKKYWSDEFISQFFLNWKLDPEPHFIPTQFKVFSIQYNIFKNIYSIDHLRFSYRLYLEKRYKVNFWTIIPYFFFDLYGKQEDPIPPEQKIIEWVNNQPDFQNNFMMTPEIYDALEYIFNNFSGEELKRQLSPYYHLSIVHLSLKRGYINPKNYYFKIPEIIIFTRNPVEDPREKKIPPGIEKIFLGSLETKNMRIGKR